MERRTSFKNLIGYSDKSIRPLVLITPKMSRYVKTFKKDKNDKLVYIHLDGEKLLEK